MVFTSLKSTAITVTSAPQSGVRRHSAINSLSELYARMALSGYLLLKQSLL